MRLSIQKQHINHFFLLIILFLGVTLRIWNIDNRLSDSFNQDEAMRGYDAYSLLETGKDHRGNSWPVYFEGFSENTDNYTPLYVYTLMPFVKILGLNEFSVRLPAVVFGVLTILIVYLLTNELFRNKKTALLSSLLLAVSPWHIFLSRLGMEVVTIPFLVSLALLFHVKWINHKKDIFLILSSLFWALSLYSYSVIRVFVPMLLFGIVFISLNDFKKNKKIFFACIIIAIIILYPLIISNLSDWDKIQGRFKEISIFSNSNENWTTQFVKNYLSTAGIYFFPFFSTFYELFFISIGILFLFLNTKYRRDYRSLLLYYFFIFPIPSALTNSNPHILRDSTAIPILQILAAYGITNMASIKNIIIPKYKRVVYGMIASSLIINTSINLFLLNKLNYTIPGFYQYGFKEVTTYFKNHKDDYTSVLFTNKANQPFIFVLFYLQYPPKDFQNSAPLYIYDAHGIQRAIASFDKFKFCNIDVCFKNQPKTLIIARNEELSTIKLPMVEQWQNPDGGWKIISNP